MSLLLSEMLNCRSSGVQVLLLQTLCFVLIDIIRSCYVKTVLNLFISEVGEYDDIAVMRSEKASTHFSQKKLSTHERQSKHNSCMRRMVKDWPSFSPPNTFG